MLHCLVDNTISDIFAINLNRGTNKIQDSEHKSNNESCRPRMLETLFLPKFYVGFISPVEVQTIGRSTAQSTKTHLKLGFDMSQEQPRATKRGLRTLANYYVSHINLKLRFLRS